MNSFLAFTAAATFTFGAGSPAFAQVSDAERASARELFKTGDQLQRTGRFAEALDKFQRAQQVFAAPTNVLRIAECDAALGRLVESAEAYRDVLRTTLAPSAPPAFQSAVDQAKAELSQVEPRVPKVIIQVQPVGAPNVQLQIDGQNVPPALIGEAVPLDPGQHKVAVVASGYASTEQAFDLKERDSKSLPLVLNPVSGVISASLGGTAGGGATGVAGDGLPAGIPPPPPPIEGVPPIPPPHRRTSSGFLAGVHLGYEGASGSIPSPDATPSNSAVGGGGLAFGLDIGLRFAHQGYLGLAVNRATFTSPTSTGATSNTTLVGLVGAWVVNPDRASFYAELGLGARWFDVRASTGSADASQLFNTGEVSLGVGVWIPAGPSFRLLPKIAFGFDAFNQNGGSSGAPISNDTNSNKITTFTTLSLAGLYNLDF